MKRISLLILLIILLLTSCKVIEQSVTTTQKQQDSTYVSKNTRDSVYIKDSIFIKEKGDTIWMKEWHWKIKEVETTDTVYINHNDTTYIDRVETITEKEIPKWVWWVLGITGTITLVVLIKTGVKIYTKIQSGGLI